MHLTTVATTVSRFVNAGYNLQACQSGKSSGRPRKVLVNSGVEKFLVSEPQLRRWCNLSLQKRCHLIRRRFNFSICTATLLKFYRRKGIRWRVTRYSLFGEHSKPVQRCDERTVFASRLRDIIAADEPLIYFDECSFNAWLRSSHSWTSGTGPMMVPLPQKRGKGFTVMGGLGNCIRGGFFGKIVQSTNKADFVEFLQELIPRLTPETKVKPWIVLDNHTAHHSKVGSAALERLCRPLWLPAYSCRFSSVETVWAHIKSRCIPIHTRFLFSRTWTREHMIALVEMEYEENISPDTFANLMRANRSYLNSFLAVDRQLG